MKKVRKAFTVILVVIAIFLVYEIKPTLGSGRAFYVATTALNVRSGAGTKYSVIFTLQEGDEVEVLSKEENWYKIRYEGRKGYAFSTYLEYSRTLPAADFGAFRQIASNILIGGVALVIILAGFIVFRKIRDYKLLNTVTKPGRGARSERDLVLKLVKLGIPPQDIFHDLYLKKNNGNFSQIDLVAITQAGIIVFEVKDYKGWIFGSGNQQKWTQVLAFGKQKYRFLNPIMQNNRHIIELKRKLRDVAHVPFYSIVLFYGDCVLKEIDFVPRGTFIVKSHRLKEVMRFIFKENEPVQYSNKEELVRILKVAAAEGANVETRIQHIENVKDILGKERIFE